MKIDDIVKLAEATSKILSALVWPVLFFSIFLYFGPTLKNFFSNADEFSIKGGGFEATIKQKKAEVAAALFAASVVRQPTTNSAAPIAYKEKEAAIFAVNSVNQQLIQRARGAKILWVDEKPENNVYERQALEAIGISFVTVSDSDVAIKKLKTEKFDAVISDMSRPPDIRAGYTLLEKLKSNEINLPFIIYSSSNSPDVVDKSKELGAFGSTNQPSELFAYVLSALNL